MQTTKGNPAPDRDEVRELERKEAVAVRSVERARHELEKRRKTLYRLRERARKTRRRMVRERLVDLGEEAARQGIDIMALNDLAADKREELFARVLAVLHDGLGTADGVVPERRDADAAPGKEAVEKAPRPHEQAVRQKDPGGKPFAETLRASTSLASATPMGGKAGGSPHEQE